MAINLTYSIDCSDEFWVESLEEKHSEFKLFPNPNNGNKYFLSGNLNFKKGKRQINTIAILNDPNKIGGIDALRPSFAVGYALPSKNITNKINNVCLKVN